MSDAREVIAADLSKHWYDYAHANNFVCADWIISALNDAGYVIVPKEPTTKMLKAAYDLDDVTLQDQWDAMLAAAGEAK